jgi:hypothetical protein
VEELVQEERRHDRPIVRAGRFFALALRRPPPHGASVQVSEILLQHDDASDTWVTSDVEPKPNARAARLGARLTVRNLQPGVRYTIVQETHDPRDHSLMGKSDRGTFTASGATHRLDDILPFLHHGNVVWSVLRNSRATSKRKRLG